MLAGRTAALATVGTEGRRTTVLGSSCRLAGGINLPVRLDDEKGVMECG